MTVTSREFAPEASAPIFNKTLLRAVFSSSREMSSLALSSSPLIASRYSPLDMFHYTSPGSHTYAGQTPNYFSVDGGATNLDYFNSNPGGDLGDWASSAGNDAYLAFSPSGQANIVSQTDITEMNALGYGLAPAIIVSGA